MGASAADSVLDGNEEARTVSRLFVAHKSALPNGLGGANPTLTTQALATRTAERIVTSYFDGKPWVGKSDPVSSIDPTVTLAVAATAHPKGGSLVQQVAQSNTPRKAQTGA
jgi:choline dehydrogenase-like flavoprotein